MTLMTLREQVFPGSDVRPRDGTRLHERARPADSPADWGEIVVEIARFERLERDVFDGPGTEREGALARHEPLAVGEDERQRQHDQGGREQHVEEHEATGVREAGEGSQPAAP